MLIYISYSPRMIHEIKDDWLAEKTLSLRSFIGPASRMVSIGIAFTIRRSRLVRLSVERKGQYLAFDVCLVIWDAVRPDEHFYRLKLGLLSYVHICIRIGLALC